MLQTSIKEFKTLAEMEACFALLQQLNPAMDATRYKQLLSQMLPNGYRMAGILTGDTCVGVSGFWVNTKLYCGKYLEVDNFVIDASHRNKQLGKQLLDWLIDQAKAANCDTVMLDAYTSNSEAHRFYFREGFHIKSYHFYRSI